MKKVLLAIAALTASVQAGSFNMRDWEKTKKNGVTPVVKRQLSTYEKIAGLENAAIKATIKRDNLRVFISDMQKRHAKSVAKAAKGEGDVTKALDKMARSHKTKLEALTREVDGLTVRIGKLEKKVDYYKDLQKLERKKKKYIIEGVEFN